MVERRVRANGVELWTDDFGDPADPTILLINGATTQSIWWEDEFCEMLVAPGRHVIRYDHRDVGQSQTFDYETNPYTIHDLAQDAVGVLDAYGVAAANVVGISAGGVVAQYLGLDHATRVKTLTLMLTTPVLREVNLALLGQKVELDLPLSYPGDFPELIATLEEARARPPQTRDEHVELQLRVLALEGGSRYPLDEERWREIVGRSFDRSRDWEARNNHWPMMMACPPDLRPRLGAIAAPTLVISGTEDPGAPPSHGEAIASAIPDAKFVPIEGLGHAISAELYPFWAELITEHTRAR